jgi:parallel beta-helix repeat protein
VVRWIATVPVLGLFALCTTTLGQTQATNSAYAATVLADAPLAYWRLADGSAGRLVDASGQGHDAAVQGGTAPTQGPLATDPEQALSFDGSTGYATDGQTLAVGPDVTLETWVKAPSGASGPILSIATVDQNLSTDSGDQHLARVLYLDNGHLWGRADVSAAWPTYSVQSPVLDPTVWHHVVFVVQGTDKLSLYVDGALAGSASTPPGSTFTGTAVLAWSNARWLPHFGGSMAEAAIYGTALSAAQILAHYQAGMGPCTATLQSQIDAAVPGSTLSVPACVYRETVKISKPLVLAGQPGAEIRGSDVWSNWTSSGSYWRSTGPVAPLPVFNEPSRCADATNSRCMHPEQVFLDGKPLAWVTDHPTAGQFALDSQRYVLLADNPAGHTVEVTTRARWVVTASDHVTIQGLTMRYAGNDALTGALSNDGHSDWAVEDSVLSDAHGAVISIHDGSNLRVLRNDVARGGNMGIHGDQVTQGLVQGNHIHDSNTDQFDDQWGAGGAKLTQQHGVVFDGNEVDNNVGPGLWSDIQSRDVTYSKNRVHDNRGPGILFEVSDGATINDNTVWNNGWGSPPGGWGAGILVSTAAEAKVYNNTLAWNAAGITVAEQRRKDAVAVHGNAVHDNFVAAARDALALAWLSDSGGLFDPASTNQGSGNRYWFANDENTTSRFAWNGWLAHLGDLSRTPGDTGGAYVAAAEEEQLLSDAGIPPSPPSH